MKRTLALLALALGAAQAAAQPPVTKAAPDGTPLPTAETVGLAFHPAAAPVPALQYRLLPGAREQKPGNRVLLYYRAFSPEWSSLLRRPEVAAQINAWLDDRRRVPGPQLHWIRQSPMLQELDRGARRSYADWELTDRVREEGATLLLPDVQVFRTLGGLLAARARLELADRQYDKAARTLQTGLRLARDLTEGPTLIHALVGNVLTTMMLEQAEEWVQAPGGPNLYWALSQLPGPFIDLRRPVDSERLMLDSLFPGMREELADVKSRPMSNEQVQALIDRVAEKLLDMRIAPRLIWQGRVSVALVAAEAYPAARRFLLGQGRSPRDVEAMPVVQAVLLFEVHNYDRLFDDMVKWSALPYPQAREGMQRASADLRQAKAAGPAAGATLAAMLVPAVQSVLLASARTERRIAALRCVEAVRLYAAAHDGKPPASLADVKDVPVPEDPVTGRPFVYTVEDNRLILYGPPPDRDDPSPRNALRYELNLRP